MTLPAHRAVFLAGLLAGLAAVGTEPAAWMAQVEGGRSLSELLIPGSHDSGATRDWWFAPASCQTASIRGQLDMGIRFLDIRCKVRNGRLHVYHGLVNQRLTFDSALAQCFEFLRDHPSECVLMSVKEEGGREFVRVFDAYVDREPERWYREPAIPRLEEVRGKVVLVRRFASCTPPARGMDASDWEENDCFTIKTQEAEMKIQDNFVVWSIRKKYRRLESLLEESRRDPSEALYLNFASGCNFPRFWDFIRACSRRINPRLQAYLAIQHAPRPRGVIVMDFVTPQLSAKVYEANFLL